MDWTPLDADWTHQYGVSMCNNWILDAKAVLVVETTTRCVSMGLCESLEGKTGVCVQYAMIPRGCIVFDVSMGCPSASSCVQVTH